MASYIGVLGRRHNGADRAPDHDRVVLGIKTPGREARLPG